MKIIRRLPNYYKPDNLFKHKYYKNILIQSYKNIFIKMENQKEEEKVEVVLTEEVNIKK